MLLFFDTETTGKYDFKASHTAPQQPHLVQLGMILDDLEGNTIEEYETIIRVAEINIPISAAEIHGITTAIANAQGIDVRIALDKFDEFWQRSNRIVAHNVEFDKKVMKTAYHRVGMEGLFGITPTYCTMHHSTGVLKLPGRYGYKWPKLEEAYRVLVDVEGFEGAHNALNDVRACRDVYYALRRLGK